MNAPVGLSGRINLFHLPLKLPLGPILVILMTGLLLASQADAKTFLVNEINNSSGYSMTVTVNGGKFLSQTSTWGLLKSTRAALFHCPSAGSVSVSVKVDHPGGLEDVRINGQESTTIRESLQMAIDQTYLTRTHGVGLVRLTGWAQSDDEQWYKIEKQFVFHVFCYKPLHVAIDNFSLSFNRSVTSYKMTPYFTANSSGETVVEFQRTNWPDVGVQVTTEESLFVTPGFWERTNAAGRKSFRFQSNTSFEKFNEYGLWHPSITLRAVKDQYELEYDTGTSLPYTVIRNVQNVWYLGASGTIGDLGEKVTLIDRLVPGDRIQVGSRATTRALVVLEFINGQIIRSEAGRYGGFVATVNSDGLAEGTALLWLDVRNAVQEVRDSPRRAGRMLVYKASGAVLDAALGVPDEVGFVSETPGGVVSKQLAKWGEEAYQPRAAVANVSMNGSASFDFFNDGTVVVENRAAPFRLIDESGRAAVVSSGSSRFVPVRGSMQGQPVAPITSTSVWEAPELGAWEISPQPGSTIVTALPDISVTNAAPAALDWSSASIRVDGVDITPWMTSQLDFDLAVLGLQGTLPDSVRLDAGEHTLEILANTKRGEMVQHAVAFSVELPVDSSGYAVARAYDSGVWISWRPPEGASDFRVYRAASVDGPYELLNQTTLRQQPGFFDSDPQPENHYRIEGLFEPGEPMLPLEVAAEWSPGAPTPPLPESVTRPRVEQDGDVLVVLFDHSFTSENRWRLERSIDGGNTFESPLPSTEETVVSGFRDLTVPAGVEAKYRITPVAADGMREGVPAYASATLPVTPATPGGLGIRQTSSGVMLNWDPYLDRRAQALHVYRDSGAGAQLLATLAADQTRYLDLQTRAAGAQYHLIAVGDHSDSAPTAKRGLLAHPATDEAANIRMAVSELWAREGSGVARVKVLREGNLSESAMVHYTTDGPTGGTAVAGQDYMPVSGTLWFAPWQTEAEISIELPPDSENNWALDQMFYVWLDINDGLFGPSTLIPEGGSTNVLIAESDVVFFPDHDLGVQAYRSDGTVDIVIQRAYPSERDIEVDIVIDPANPGDSIPGVDWIDSRPWRASFNAGQPTAVVTIKLLKGGSDDRVLNLKLQQPTGGASLEEVRSTLSLKIQDETPPPRASVEVTGMAQRPGVGFMPGTVGCIDVFFVNRGPVETSGALTVEFMPPAGFRFPKGLSLGDLVLGEPAMECFYWSDPESDPTVTCMSMTPLAADESGFVSVAFETGWTGTEEVPFFASVGDVSRSPPDLSVCATETDRPGCGTMRISVFERLFSDGFEALRPSCLR